MDEQGRARYAFLRGIYDNRGKSFRMEQEGSEKQYSFCVPPPPLGKSCRVAVYEACIDALAPVSYTHLDVYKRQFMKGLLIKMSDRRFPFL